jgi:hypothetical protein
MPDYVLAVDNNEIVESMQKIQAIEFLSPAMF